jgi:hypothetical protein
MAGFYTEPASILGRLPILFRLHPHESGPLSQPTGCLAALA